MAILSAIVGIGKGIITAARIGTKIVRVGIGLTKAGVKAVKLGIGQGKTLLNVGKKAKKATGKLAFKVNKAVNNSRKLTADIANGIVPKPELHYSNIFRTESSSLAKKTNIQPTAKKSSVGDKVAELRRMANELEAESRGETVKNPSSDHIVKSRIFTEDE